MQEKNIEIGHTSSISNNEMNKRQNLAIPNLIVPYDPLWAIHFKEINDKLQNALFEIEIKIEHVGSTAIPSLAAKPIIDIDIVYFQTADFEYIKNKLEVLGYYHNGNQNIEGREVFKRNGIAFDKVLDGIPHHLYVCKIDSEELNRHISFKNYLIKCSTIFCLHLDSSD